MPDAVQVKGGHVDVTDSLFSYAERKLSKIARHLSDESWVELELIVEHNPRISENQVAEATDLDEGPSASEPGNRPRTCTPAIDLVADKLERQVVRYRERRSRRSAASRRQTPRPRRPVATLPEEDESVIVKTKQFNMKPMGEEEAALQLELIGHDFFVFVNQDSDKVTSSTSAATVTTA